MALGWGFIEGLGFKVGSFFGTGVGVHRGLGFKVGHFLSLLFFENAYCFACILKKLFVLVSAGCMFHCGVL